MPRSRSLRVATILASPGRQRVNRQIKLSVNRFWPLVSLLPIAAISWSGQVLSRPSSRVRSPGSSTGAVVLRSQTALTGSDRPRTIPAAGAGTPTCTDETCCTCQAARLSAFAPADRRWRRRSGSASGSEGERAVAAARAARRAALKPYRKFSHSYGAARRAAKDRVCPAGVRRLGQVSGQASS